MPFMVFSDASVLTAAQVNDYLMEQVITTCTSGTRPSSPNEGQFIYETDTNRYYVYNSSWRTVGSAGATAFTPTWSGLTLGNGTQSWQYSYVPNGLLVTGKLTFGTTTSISGSVSMTVPNSHSAGADCSGSAHYLDSGTRHWVGSAVVDSGGERTVPVRREPVVDRLTVPDADDDPVDTGRAHLHEVHRALVAGDVDDLAVGGAHGCSTSSSSASGAQPGRPSRSSGMIQPHASHTRRPSCSVEAACSQIGSGMGAPFGVTR